MDFDFSSLWPAASKATLAKDKACASHLTPSQKTSPSRVQASLPAVSPDKLTPIGVAKFKALFHNPAYTYELSLNENSDYIMNVWATPGGGATMDSHLFWNPPWPLTKMKLAQAKEGAQGFYFEFEIGEPWEMLKYQGGVKTIFHLQRSYILVVPHDPNAMGSAWRIEKNLDDGSIVDDHPEQMSYFHRLNVGDVTGFILEKRDLIGN